MQIVNSRAVLGVIFRDGKDSDRPLIADSIRRGLKKNSPYAKDMSNGALSKLIDPLLATYQVLIACPASDVDSIVGFIVYGPERKVVWLQVRGEFRRRGLGRELLGAIGFAPGPVKTPLAVHNWDGPGSFQSFAWSKGYKVLFRPWDVLQIMSDIEEAA